MNDVTTVLFQKRKRKSRKKSKATGEKLFTRSEWEKKYWDAFSLYIRERDNWKCVMAGWRNHVCSGKWLQAGHVIPKEDVTALKFDERDVFAQCSGSNLNHKYHPSEFTTWFLQHHGQDLYDELSMAGKKPYKKPTIEECKKGIEEFTQRRKLL